MIAEELVAEGRLWVEAWRLKRGQQAPPLIAAVTHDLQGRHVTVTAHDVDQPNDPHERLTRTCSVLVLLATNLQATKVGLMCDVQLGIETALMVVVRERGATRPQAMMVPFAVKVQPDVDPTVEWGNPIGGPDDAPPPMLIVSAFERAFGARLTPVDQAQQLWRTSLTPTEWDALDHLTAAESLTARRWRVKLRGSIQHVSLAERLSRLDDNQLLTVRM